MDAPFDTTIPKPVLEIPSSVLRRQRKRARKNARHTPDEWDAIHAATKAARTERRKASRPQRWAVRIKKLRAKGIPVPESRPLAPDEYAAYILSERWQAKRKEAISRAGGKCSCGSTVRLEVHHKTYERLGCELPDDLEVLCRPCHAAVHETANN